MLELVPRVKCEINGKTISRLQAASSPASQAIAGDLQKFNHFAGLDVGVSVFVARRVLDVLVKSICTANNVDMRKKPLEALINELRNNGLYSDMIFNHCMLIKNFGNTAVHGTGELTDTELEMCAHSLDLVTKWFSEEISSQVLRTNRSGEIHILSIREVGELGWSPEDVMARIIELDYKLLENIPAQHEGTLAQWLEKWTTYPESGRVMVTAKGKLIGYWSTACLHHEDFELMKRGEIFDGDLSPSRMCSFELPGIYKLYFVTVCIETLFRSAQSLRLLLGSFLDVLQELAEQGIFFDEMCANAYTARGEALCRSIGMKHLCDHKDSGHIYWEKMLPLRKIEFFECKKRLIELYDSKSKLCSEVELANVVATS